MSRNDSDQGGMSGNGSLYHSYPRPPEPLGVDRIQLALLVLLFAVGAPINLVSFTKLRSRRSLARTGRLALLRLHLNISDLMVLFIFVTSNICWQLTYEWRGGDLLCKLVKFLNSTSFQLSSNIMVCVALDRVFTVICGTVFYKRYVNRHPAKYVRISVIVSWILAVGLNFSQFFVWVVVAPFPHTDPQWHQCITVWSASAHFNRLSVSDPANKHFYAHAMKPPFQMNQFTYNVFHIAVVFWIPAAIIVISYTIVVLHMFNLSAKRKTSQMRMAKVKTCVTIEDGQTQVSNVIPSGLEMQQMREKENKPFTNGSAAKTDTNDTDDTTFPSPMDSQASAASKSHLLPVAIHRMRNKTFRMSLLLVLAYFLCWAPYNILALWQFIDSDGYRRSAIGMKFLNVLIVFNSVVNPFLYGTLKCKLPCRLRPKRESNND